MENNSGNPLRASNPPSAIELLLTERLEAATDIRQPLAHFAATHPNLRVIDGRFKAIEQMMGTPRGRSAAARHLRRFVEEMKASGFVADAVARTGLKDATVAPRAPVRD